MSRLNEAAFLRSLLLEEAEIDQPRRSCPEPSILWALMQKDRRDSDMAEDLRNHIAVCPSCLDLTKRLYAFHRSVQGEVSHKAEASWAESRPKLNQWFDDFLHQQESQAQPSRKPLALVPAPPQRPRFFNLAWMAPTAVAVVALAAVMVFLSRRASQDQGGTAQVASAPIQPQSGAPSVSSLPSPPSDQQLMMNNHADNSTAEPPQTIIFNGGERMKLQLISVRPMQDGSYRVTGTLMPIDPQNAPVDSAEVSAVFAARAPGHLELTIKSAEFRSRTYHVPAANIDDVVKAVTVDSHAVPQAGRTIEVEIKSAPNLRIEPRE
jgi:hypothetical protein